MVNDVVQMLEKVLNAYARDDDSELRKVINFDQVVDEKFRHTLNELMSFILNNKESVGVALTLYSLQRHWRELGITRKTCPKALYL